MQTHQVVSQVLVSVGSTRVEVQEEKQAKAGDAILTAVERLRLERIERNNKRLAEIMSDPPPAATRSAEAADTTPMAVAPPCNIGGIASQQDDAPSTSAAADIEFSNSTPVSKRARR